MTPDNVILIQLCIIAMALFTALHFAWQANHYKLEAERASDLVATLQAKKPQHGHDGKFVSKRISKAIELATENGRDDLVLKLQGRA